MKYLLLIVLFVSCNQENRRNYIVYMANGKGLNYSSSYIYVDSITETTPKSITFWIDGRRTTVYSERIQIGN